MAKATSKAPSLISVDKARWNVRDRRKEMANGQIHYDLRMFSAPGVPLYPHPRGWDNVDLEDLQLISAVNLTTSEPWFVAFYSRPVAVHEGGIDGYRDTADKFVFTAAEFAEVLGDPEGFLAHAREQFDAKYGVEVLVPRKRRTRI